MNLCPQPLDFLSLMPNIRQHAARMSCFVCTQSKSPKCGSLIPRFPLLGLTTSGLFNQHLNLHFRVNSLFYHFCFYHMTSTARRAISSEHLLNKVPYEGRTRRSDGQDAPEEKKSDDRGCVTQ